MAFRKYKADEIRNSMATAGIHNIEFLSTLKQWVQSGQPFSGEIFIEDQNKYLIYQLDRQRNTMVKFSDTSQIEHKMIPKSSNKIGRNELCPCGSGRKFKYCCGSV